MFPIRLPISVLWVVGQMCATLPAQTLAAKRAERSLTLKALGEEACWLASMFAIFFSIVVVIGLLSICGEIVMRVRLTRVETANDKLAWWRRGGDEVAATYEGLFPRSRLPLFRRFAFWLFLACSAVMLLSILWKSN